MALIDTAGAANTWVNSNQELVQSLRLAVAEECAAANTYERLATGILNSAVPGYDQEGKARAIPEGRLSVDEAKALSNAILEIARDESRHTGKLLRLIKELSPDTASDLVAGEAEA